MSYGGSSNRGGYGGGYGTSSGGGGYGGGYGNPPNQGGGGYGAPQGRDGDSEYIRLNQSVTNNIVSINNKVNQIQKLVDQLNGRDDERIFKRINQLQEETKPLFQDTSNSLKQLGQLDGGSGNEQRQRKAQQSKLSADFKAALLKFQDVSKVTLKKEKESVVHERERAQSFKHQHDDFEEKDNTALLQDDRRRQQQQLDNQIDFTNAMIQEREEGIREIEATMMEVNEIFRDLAVLVNEQGQHLDSIEANISASLDHTETGTKNLVKASDYQKKARSKMCIVLIIVAVVAAILTVVLVTQLKK